MTKRLILLGLLVAAFLVLAAPALGFDGFRDTYFNTTGTATQVGCAGCHEDGTLGPAVYNDYAMTAHAQVGTVVARPSHGRGRRAARPTPSPSPTARAAPAATAATTTRPRPCRTPPACTRGRTPPTSPATTPSASPSSAAPRATGARTSPPTPVPTAAHAVPMANMANPDICGQCHSRYSNSVVPYPNYNGTSALRQYTRGDFSPLGYYNTVPPWTPQPIADFLLVPSTTAPQQMIYYTLGTETLPYNARAHEEGATQYNEWAHEGHANALDALKAIGQGSNPAVPRVPLHRLRAGHGVRRPSGDAAANAKYGVTCVGCHKPHKQSAQTSFWNEERNPQLVLPRNQLCVQCHNAELAPQANGQPGVATPGSSVHHPMNEMMNGTGAIDVPQGSPSVSTRASACSATWCRRPGAVTPTACRRGQGHRGQPRVRHRRAGGRGGGRDHGRRRRCVRNMPASSCSTCHKQDGTAVRAVPAGDCWTTARRPCRAGTTRSPRHSVPRPPTWASPARATPRSARTPTAL